MNQTLTLKYSLPQWRIISRAFGTIHVRANAARRERMKRYLERTALRGWDVIDGQVEADCNIVNGAPSQI